MDQTKGKRITLLK